MAKKLIDDYICPNCKEKQTAVHEWQTISVCWEFVLEKDVSEATEVDRAGADHEAWTCPNCGEDLPPELAEQVSESIFG